MYIASGHLYFNTNEGYFFMKIFSEKVMIYKAAFTHIVESCFNVYFYFLMYILLIGWMQDMEKGFGRLDATRFMMHHYIPL